MRDQEKKMYPIRLFLKYRPILLMATASLGLNIATWVWLLWNIRPQTEQIFLHYTVLFGVDLIGDWSQILYLPIAGFLIILINTLIGWVLFRNDKFIAQMFAAIALFCQLIIFIAAWLLVFMNV